MCKKFRFDHTKRKETEEESSPYRPQQEYFEESCWFEKIQCYSDSSERFPTEIGVKKITKREIIDKWINNINRKQ